MGRGLLTLVIDTLSGTYQLKINLNLTPNQTQPTKTQ